MSDINLALLPDFILEAREHLDEIEGLLLKLADSPNDLETLNDIFRPVHNIKGGSQITGLERVARLSHRLEDLLDILRQGNMTCTADIVDLMIETRDRIVQMVAELEATQEEQSEIDDLVSRLSAHIEGEQETPTPQKEEKAQVVAEMDDQAYVEEHDQELFGIFIAHLREQVQTLHQAVEQEYQGSDLDHHLAWCSDIVESLWSAANYMGYQDLAILYQEWSDALSYARNALANGEEASADFMKVFLHRLESQFPNLEQWDEETGAQVGETSVAAEPEAPAPAVETPAEPVDDVTAAVMDMFADEGSSAEEAVTESAPPAPAPAEEQAMEMNMALLPDFIVEAGEHLDEIEAILLQLSDDPGNLDLLNDVFRPMHNIKGGSQITGLPRIARLSHRLEDLLDLLRNGELESDTNTIDLLIDARDRIVQLVNELSLHSQELSDINDLVMEISHRIDGSTGLSQQASESPQTPATEAAAPVEPSMNDKCLYEEEHDQELFGIFMTHLREQTSILRKSIDELHREPDKVQHLQWCSDTVGRLWSAANYMGFDELTELYENWGSQVDSARNAWASGTQAPLDFMEINLAQLDAMFPQLKHVPTTAIEGEKDHPPVEATPAAPAAPAAQVPEIEPDMAALADELSGALEDVMNQAPSEQQMSTLNQVFEETMSSAQADKTTAPQTPAQAPVAEQTPAEKRRASEAMEKKIKKSMRVDAEKIDSLMNLVGELVVDRSYFFQLANEMRNLQNYFKDLTGIDQKEVKMMRTFTYRLGEAIASLGRTSNELQEGVMKMRMLPISQIFNRYPRLVRDLTHNTDKKVELVIQGEDTELDKMIVEELSDPLIHIIRNAVDHGLEFRDERRQNGKPEAGTLTLNAYQESNNVVIEVTDDGRGINPEKVKKKAAERGLFTVGELDQMNERDITQMILMPGFSTAEKVTGTSGRGVGMDVVKRNIEKLNGILEIDSKPGVSTQMRLKIPLTLAIIHALMIRVGQDLFTIPLTNVDETVRIYRHETSKVEGVEVIHLRGQALPVFHLSKLFGIKSDEKNDKVFVVIVNTEGSRTGFVVDELIGQEEVVIKPLADYVQEKSGFSGATIVGDGRISLILDAYEMVKMTSGRQKQMHQKQAAELRTRIRRGPRKGLTQQPPPNDSLH